MSTENAASIWDKAVCLSLTLHKPGNYRKVKGDYKLAKKSNGENGDTELVEMGTDRDMVRLNKTLIDAEEYDLIGKIDSKITASVKVRSLPAVVLKNGIYPIPVQLVPKVDEELDKLISEREAAVESYLTVYDAKVEEALGRLDECGNPEDYPSKSAVREAFYCERDWIEFRTPAALKSLEGDFWEKAKEKAEANWAKASEKIEAAMAEQMLSLTSHLHDCLAPSTDGKRRRFYDTTLTHLTDFLTAFRDKNISDDTELLELVEKAEGVLKGVTTNGIRSEMTVRHDLKQNMDSVKEALTGLVETRSRKFRV